MGQELTFGKSHVGIHKRQGLAATEAVHPVYEERFVLGKCPNYDRSKPTVNVIPKLAAASTPPASVAGTVPPTQVTVTAASQSTVAGQGIVAAGALSPQAVSTITINDPQVTTAPLPGGTTPTEASGQGIVAAGSLSSTNGSTITVNNPSAIQTPTGAPGAASSQGFDVGGTPSPQALSTITVNDPQAVNSSAVATLISMPGIASSSLFSSTITITANGSFTSAGAPSPAGGSTVTINVDGTGVATLPSSTALQGVAGAQGSDACTCMCRCPLGSFSMGEIGQPSLAVGGGSSQPLAGIPTTMLTMSTPAMFTTGSGQGIVASGVPPPEVMSTISVNDPQVAANSMDGVPTTFTTADSVSAAPALTSSPAFSLTSTFVSQTASAFSPQTNISASPAPTLSATGTALADMNGLPSQRPSQQSILTLGGTVVTLQSTVTVPLVGRRNVRSQVEV